MAIELVAGQTIATDFTLLHEIEGRSNGQLWLAMQESTQERVQLEFLDAELDLDRVQLSLDQYKPLIHPNILLSYRLVAHEELYCLISAYRRNLKPLDLSRPLSQVWPELKVIVEALQYAHSLGFVHGRLTPSCCNIGDDGHVYLNGFGQPVTHSGAYVANDVEQSSQSDLFSIAQILFTCLTGAPLTGQQQPLGTPIEPDLENLLRSMLAPDPHQRPADFHSLIELLDTQAQKAVVQPSEFSRSQEAPAAAATTATQDMASHKLPRERTVVSAPVAIAALALIIALATLLFLFLPETEITTNSTASTSTATNTPTKTAPESSEQPRPPELTPLELAKIEALKAQGVELAATLLRRQVEVEDIGGGLWAGDRYDASTNLGIAGDEAYREEKYQQAVDQYQAGIALLEEILAETEAVFSETLARGERALRSGDFETAQNAYRILTRIEPDNQSLRSAKVRADNLEQVVRLSQDAEVMERNGDLNAALEKFTAANNIDKVWQAAIDGIKRINATKARNRFQDEMSKGFAAIASKDFAAAEAAFNAAQSILPNSKEPLDGLQQIELAKTQASIESLKQKATELEQAGQWHEAMPVYEQVLAISPGLGTAVNGLRNAREQADLKDMLVKYIDQPHLMKSDDELKAARATLVAASQNEHFKEEARTLSHLVSLARLEIQVVLRSDQRTDVTVYQVGQYGKIEQAELALIPGVYTFVGKRPGYRDVYQEVHIKGDVNPVTVDVICSERI